MGRLSQQLGEAGEERARWFFAENGFRCVEKIFTPMRNIKGRAVYVKESSVDFIVVIPLNGSIIQSKVARVEVKLCDGNKLPHSVLEDHQIKTLTEWDSWGNWSFVLWVHKSDCFMIRYPCDFFKYGKSISVEKAKKVSAFKSCGK
ncbi:MAG: Holliday junction resolvase RecU [Deltaproteobacteria bacterium]|nr:Holliday junction resolvase RecU [Deltaproteobacteria bacterium]